MSLLREEYPLSVFTPSFSNSRDRGKKSMVELVHIPVGFSAMPHDENKDDPIFAADVIDDAIVSDPDPPEFRVI